jgi:ATP-dependent DNA helicase RecG
MKDILSKSLVYVKGIGPKRAEVISEDLGIDILEDLIYRYPFRYVDKSVITFIKDIGNTDSVQLKGTITSKKVIKGQKNSRLTATLKDSTGRIELVWFKGVKWMEKLLELNKEYLVYGRPNPYAGAYNIAHPEIELSETAKEQQVFFEPVYSSSERLSKFGFDNKLRRKIIKQTLKLLSENDVKETLPEYLIKKLKLATKLQALVWIHFPKSKAHLEKARQRIKFEEIFYFQLRMIFNKNERKLKYKGHSFENIGQHFNKYFREKLPFELTGAQKRVIKEIRADLGSSQQMNRLLQGDVGSGKTMVGLLSMLIAIDNGYQAMMMAPTEILAQQHYNSISESLKSLGINVAFLSGSVRGKVRNEILRLLAAGHIHILIGTHAIFEDHVIFDNLGLAIIDEQHRFGVMQRARLWKKGKTKPPHILVMTATPIPRTLSMTLYADLDISIIDELPPGRKEIKTIHKYDKHRPQIIEFLHSQIKEGRQIYIVYPLIDESAKLDLANLQEGYERLLQYFPPPDYKISVVHGRMKPKDKDMEMQRFVNGATQIMVATTVIEVGVNVPNATVMMIENTERFGLSQLHQLRGRVGRGGDQSFCILMSSHKLSKEARFRIKTMCETNDGFKIAEADLELRGPGDLEGTRQSGGMDFNLFSLAEDQTILYSARQIATTILNKDPYLENINNKVLKDTILSLNSSDINLGRIS